MCVSTCCFYTRLSCDKVYNATFVFLARRTLRPKIFEANKFLLELMIHSTRSFVSCLVWGKFKALTTKLTYIVPFFSVNYNMTFPVLFKAKTFPTICANPLYLPWIRHPRNLTKGTFKIMYFIHCNISIYIHHDTK